MQEATTTALRALIPPPRLRLSEWLEKEIRLPDDVSALPGPLRLYPFQTGIADALSDPGTERVTVIKSARIGYTTLLVGALAGYVANEPAPILFVLPTEDDARNFVVSNVEPTFEASPALAGALRGDQLENNRNTMLRRRFPGGSLKVVAAKSPRNLRAHNTRILFIDECDSMANTAEGNPLLLAEKRTLSFPDRKIIIGSTPVDMATSHVVREYAKSDQRVYEVPCPGCGDFHEIRWADIRWPEGEPTKAHYCCPSCGSVVEETHKTAMVAAGRWRATAPFNGHAGFRINALVSPLANASWAKLAAEFLDFKSDPDNLRVFVNTVLGEAFGDEADDLDETEIASRVEPFGIGRIPEAVLYLTIGADVQDDRIEAATVGWDRDDAAYVLDHAVIFGSPDDNNTWAELDALITARHQHPLGGAIGIDAVAVDSGDGDWSQRVYDFTFPRLRRRVMSVKGMAGSLAVLAQSGSKTARGLYLVGVDVVKNTIMNRLTRGSSIRFSDSLGLHWFEQLCSERKVVRYQRGRPTTRWERKPGRAAEALDCVVYAYAARQAVPNNFDLRAAELRLEPQQQARPRTIQSAWMNS